MPFPQKPKSFILNKALGVNRGLVFDMPFFERGGLNSLDTVSGKKAVLTAGTLWNIGQFGAGISLGSSQARKCGFIAPNYVNNLVRQTVQIIFHTPASWVDNQKLFIKGSDSGNNRYLQIGEAVGGFGFVTVSARSITNGVWTNAFPTSGIVCNMIVTYDNSSNSNNPAVYYNGIAQSVSTFLAPNGTIVADSTDLTIGNNVSAADNLSFKDDIYLVREWNRILTAREIQQMTQDPGSNYNKSSVLGKAAAAAVQAVLRRSMGMGA